MRSACCAAAMTCQYPAGDIEVLEDSDDEDGEGELTRSRYADLVERVTDSRPSETDLDAYGMAATLDFELEAKQELLELRSEGRAPGAPAHAVRQGAHAHRPGRDRRRAGPLERQSEVVAPVLARPVPGCAPGSSSATSSVTPPRR